MAKKFVNTSSNATALGSDNTPFFIVGVHRSGTTLLRYILSSHPRLYIPPETDFIPYFFARNPQERLNEQRVAQILQVIFNRYRYVEDWQGPVPNTHAFFQNNAEPTPAGFLNKLYGMYAHQNSAVRWGDKTPIYASYMDLIHQIFPQAKFIHIYRDPFDASISLLEKYEADEFHIDIYFAARNWLRRIRHIQKSRLHLEPKGLYLELAYESLVSDPETEIKKVCHFLREEFHPEMLEPHQLAKKDIPPDSHFFANVRKPLFTHSVGRGRRDLSPRDKRIIQSICQELMVELGYPLEKLGEMELKETSRMLSLRAKYEILQFGRRILQYVGLFPPI